MFIFYLILLDRSIKPFCIKVLKHSNGKVSGEILCIIKPKIFELFSDESLVSHQYISTDGDNGYNCEYKEAFKFVYNYIKSNGIEKGFQNMFNCWKFNMAKQKMLNP